MIEDERQVELAQDFIRDLECALGIKQEVVSWTEEWSKNPPKEAQSSSLDEYMIPVSLCARCIIM
jgi:hypothetical protein